MRLQLSQKLPFECQGSTSGVDPKPPNIAKLQEWFALHVFLLAALVQEGRSRN